MFAVVAWNSVKVVVVASAAFVTLEFSCTVL